MLVSLRNLAIAGMALATTALTAPAMAAGGYHVMLTPDAAARLGRVPHAPTSGAMEYFGGSVFAKVNVVSVMWGSNVNSQTVAGMPGYFTAIVNSTYVDQLSIYDTKGVKGIGGHKGKNNIARGKFFGQVVITPKNTSTSLQDSDIQKELAYQIKKGKLPAQNPNTLYMIFFPQNVSITLDGLRSCVDFGAYHFSSSTTPVKTNIFYGVMPDCGYSFNSHTIVSAHEFAEATTDNIPTPGSDPAYPQAWNTSDGFEIGDLCEGTQGNLVAGKTTYLVQELYLNNIAGCGTANFTSP